MRKESIITDGYYHIYNRGVDRRPTYNNDDDRERFIRAMIAFNNEHIQRVILHRSRLRPEKSANPLVKILCYALMPNHYHLLVQQLTADGIAKYMQRLGLSYASYFNKQNARTGRLWESEYKAVRIESDAQLLHISRYIHLNPLKLFLPQWKIRGVENWKQTNFLLTSYPWSSYRYFLGLENDPVINDDILQKMFNGPSDYENFVKIWVSPGVQN